MGIDTSGLTSPASKNALAVLAKTGRLPQYSPDEQNALLAVFGFNAARRATTVEEARIAAVIALEDLRRVAGDKKAASLWKELGGTIKQRRGPPKGARNLKREFTLLAMYDAFVEDAPGKRASVPRRIGKILYERYGDEYGNSADAIRKHVMRAVERRAERR